VAVTVAALTAALAANQVVDMISVVFEFGII
jgi:hypothetical protein